MQVKYKNVYKSMFTLMEMYGNGELCQEWYYRLMMDMARSLEWPRIWVGRGWDAPTFKLTKISRDFMDKYWDISNAR